MRWNIRRGGQFPPNVPLHHIGRRTDDTYVLFDGEDLETANIRLRVPLRSYFGHLALALDGSAEETLFVLGCEEVFAYRPSLDLRWHGKEVAVDGITFERVEGSHVCVKAEMDPPGGWYQVEIDLATGAELSRRPAFSDGYSRPD